MTQINLNGLQLNYEVSGCGKPLILLGGLTANCREWSRMLPYLESQFRVYRPENRGAGLTMGGADAFTIEQMADDIACFIEYLALDDVCIVGHSMGGAIAQSVCINYPQRVKAVIIASSFPYFPKAAQLYIENTSALFAAGLDAQLVLKTLYTRLYGSEFLSREENIEAELGRMLNDATPQTPAGYQAQVNAIARFNSLADLQRIQSPTLILNGQEDILTPHYLTAALHAGIADSKLVLLPDCGHMIPQEKPQQFSELICDFFID